MSFKCAVITGQKSELSNYLHSLAEIIATSQNTDIQLSLTLEFKHKEKDAKK